jgi:GxxExxY protein
MTEQHHLRRTGLLFPGLSYKINWVLFEVFRQIGGGHEEKYYQKAIALGLESAKILFSEQHHVPLKFNETIVGKYFLDFLVDNKIILEIKRGKFISALIIKQVERYLEALNLDLALIACFTYNGVTVKRIINPRRVPKSKPAV